MLAENLSVKIETVDNVIALYRAGIISLIDARILLGLPAGQTDVLGLGDPIEPKPMHPQAFAVGNSFSNGPPVAASAPRIDANPVLPVVGRPGPRMASEKMQKALWAIAQDQYSGHELTKTQKYQRFVQQITQGRTKRLEDVTFDEARSAMGQFGGNRRPQQPTYQAPVYEAPDDDVSF